MNFRRVFHVVSIVVIVIGLCIGAAVAVAHRMGDSRQVVQGLAMACGASILAGLLLWSITRGPVDLSRRDGFGIVTFGWLSAALFGALPYILTGIIPDFTGAFFETMSGFTTTGASILTDLEAMPRGILFWRALTQWLGGMGVLVLVVAILPFLGVSGMQIYQAEMPGPSKERLTPRIARTAELLWGIYVLLSVLLALLLRWAGMSWYDAVCHTFTTLSTGGFSTLTDSVAGFDSLRIEIILIIFMFLAGANYTLHFRAITGRPLVYFRDPECRFYLLVWLCASFFLAFNLRGTHFETLPEALRAGFFQATSILTTTGFATADFDAWPTASRLLLLALMVSGASAGSTSGGVKLIRIYVLVKRSILDIRAHMLPHAVLRLKVGKKPLDPSIAANISTFFIIFLLLGGIATLLMSFYMPDPISAVSAVLATLGNIGPGLGVVGPTENFAFVAPAGKMILSVCMLLGRLELYTVLVLLLPDFWKK